MEEQTIVFFTFEQVRLLSVLVFLAVSFYFGYLLNVVPDTKTKRRNLKTKSRGKVNEKKTSKIKRK